LNGTATHTLFVQLLKHTPGFVDLAGTLKQPSTGDLNGFKMLRITLPGMTKITISRLKIASLLCFQGPLDTFFLREDEPRPAIVVGGGTGLAPLKATLDVALAKYPDRTLHLFWSVRSSEDLYFENEISRWLNRHANLGYTSVLPEPKAADGWDGETGFVHEAVFRQYPKLDGFEVYASGPPPDDRGSENHILSTWTAVKAPVL